MQVSDAIEKPFKNELRILYRASFAKKSKNLTGKILTCIIQKQT
jgi:hypothetical protein